MNVQPFFAPFASCPDDSRGRLFHEPETQTRSVFQRDRDRIIHSEAFRRLKYKTQVFVYHEGDHYRTRLTHSLEVAQVARSISRALALNEDLAEALALAHDLGHPPFGHAGEDALREMMKAYDGFDHNAQSFRIVTSLEQRYADFDGLNLTWEALEGLVKHNGPLLVSGDATPLPWAITAYPNYQGLELHTFSGLEAQVAALSDDIAYNNHDIDDGLRAGLFSIEALTDVSLVGSVLSDVRFRYPKIDTSRLIHETVRRLINVMVLDVLEETRRRIDEENPLSVEDVRNARRPLVAFSADMMVKLSELRNFLFTHMYRHYKVNRMTSKARRVVRKLFLLFLEEPQCLPSRWFSLCDEPKTPMTARVVADYIAGMTDRAALSEYCKLFEVHETP